MAETESQAKIPMDMTLKKRVVDTLTTLDSYLSLSLYRGTGPNVWDAGDRRQVESAIVEARKLCDEFKPDTVALAKATYTGAAKFVYIPDDGEGEPD